jgi:hypothetical protein
MIRAYESGLTIEGVAKRFCLGPARVGAALKRAGVTRPAGHRSLDERQFCLHGHELAVVGIYRPPNGDPPRCKACIKAAVSKWQTANRERLRVNNRAYYWANRTKLLANASAYNRKRNDARRVKPWQSRRRKSG